MSVYKLVLLILGLYAFQAKSQVESAIPDLNGKELYIKNCSSCHDMAMTKLLIGPPLGEVSEMMEREWLYSYTRSALEMRKNGDERAIENQKKYPIMPPFSLSDKELDAIYTFILKQYSDSKEESLKDQ